MTAKISDMGVSTKGKAGWKSVLRVSRKNIPALTPTSTPNDTSRQQSPVNSCTLEKKYGTPRKALGDGAFGSIFLVDRPSDGATFAVKKFRRQHALEDSREYARKIIKEYYIGSKLQHGNVIKTLELFQEGEQWSQVMEYAPYCLFDCVASKQMSIPEINCAFLQILAGVNHLHQSGFAHRDLKLENVVVTAEGIMKVIDFGTATVVNSETQKSILATGMVGCLPYMAPEVLKYHCYDAQRADLWSLGITYACMVLGKFPWKVAETRDRAYRAFSTVPARRSHDGSGSGNSSGNSSESEGVTVVNVRIGDKKDGVKEEILGPWNLLGRLPVESRKVIGAMLKIEANGRPLLGEVMESQWVKGSGAEGEICHLDGEGVFCRAEGHRHTLRGGSVSE